MKGSGIYRLIGVIGLMGLIWMMCNNRAEVCESVYQDTMRVTVYDTIAYHQPVPKEEKPLGSITAKLPVSVPKLPVSVPEDHSEDMDEMVTPDSAEVVVPITQTVYEDSTYTAYVSGYRASLDSLIFYPRYEVVTITKQEKPKRWSVSIQAGCGVVLGGRVQIGPYIGVGVSYNLISL